MTGYSLNYCPDFGVHYKPTLRSSGTALFNLNRTLNLIFDGQATLKINSELRKYTNAIITLPKRSSPWTEYDVW